MRLFIQHEELRHIAISHKWRIIQDTEICELSWERNFELKVFAITKLEHGKSKNASARLAVFEFANRVELD